MRLFCAKSLQINKIIKKMEGFIMGNENRAMEAKTSGIRGNGFYE